MPVELLVAPPASGKTEKCIQKIQSVSSSNPLAKVWVVVPDSKKRAYFQQRLAAAGGGIGIHIGTFRNLYQDILESNHVFVPVITSTLGHRLVQETVDEAFIAHELNHYASIRQKPGFILSLQDIFAEMRGALVRPERFLEYTGKSNASQYELASLYARYLERLDSLNWIDQEGQSWLAISTLVDNPCAAGKTSLVVVDGFTSFTGARRQFLKELSAQVDEVLITLPGKLKSTRTVHRRSQKVIQTVENDLATEACDLKEPQHLPAECLYLEQHVLDAGEYEKFNLSKSMLLEVRSLSEEAREALRWIKSLHVRDGLPLNSCAVFVPNIDIYRPMLRSAAKEFGIPVKFSKQESLVESPAIISLLNLLSLPLNNYKTRNLLNVIRSPFFDFGFDAQILDGLERVSQQACIVTGRDQWDDAWRMLQNTNIVNLEELDDERWQDKSGMSIDILTLRNRLDNFWLYFESITGDQSQQEWVGWLEQLLVKLHFYKNLSNEQGQQVFESLRDSFHALVLSEKVAGIRSTNYAQFYSDLEGSLGGARINEPKGSRKNSLWIGEMVEARGLRFSATALLGFSEGLFPAVESPDPFLDENLRKDLGLEPRLQREQASIFYQAITRTNQHLLITRPYLSEEGENWDASPYWLAVKKLLSENSCEEINPNTIRPQAEAASTQELLFWAIQQNHIFYQEDAELFSRWKYLTHAGKVLDARRSKFARGEYEGSIEAVASLISEKYNAEKIWSASRFEEYATCPYKFYINSLLRLKARSLPELGLNVLQIGIILHRVLELVYTMSGFNNEAAAMMDNLEEISESVFKTAPADLGFRPSPLWEVEKAELVENLRKTIQGLEKIRQDWVPLCFEQKFGVENGVDLVIDIGEELIHLRGLIDRVDKNSNGEIRIIDYKTGGSHLGKSDFLSGRRLQLPIYAFAAQDALNLGQIVDGFYWKILEGKASSFKLATYEGGGSEGMNAAYAMVVLHLRRIVFGIRAGDFSPRAPRGGCPDYCPAAQWCWRYQGGF